jgi:hypothetical protein
LITPSDIVKHLKIYLPIFTDKFTKMLTVSAASITAGNILNVTSTVHGKTAWQSVVISGGTVRNSLTASILDGSGGVTFTTGTDHDLIKPSKPLDDQTLTLAGFSSVWDGEHDIIDVPNRRNFTVNLPTGETLAPAIDGSQYLIESLTFGVQEIDTVPSINTFTIDLSSAPTLPIGPIDDLSIISGFRIAAAADFNRAQAAYSKQTTGEPYLFVIMTDTDVSKDRHTMNDGVAGMTRQDEMLLRLLQSFSTSVFIPTSKDLSGADAQDLAYGDLFRALLQALFGYEPEGSQIRYLNVPSGHGPGEYNSAYYVHVYDWQLPDVINYEDGFLQQPDVAFRDIEQTLKLFSDNEAEMLLNINLDDEPL